MIRNFSIQKRITFQSALIAIGLIVLTLEGLNTLYNTMNTATAKNTQSMVEVAFSVLDRYHAFETNGTMTRAEAQNSAAEVIKALRYENGNYYWIQSYDLKMLMHPKEPSLVGEDLSTVKDPSGKSLFSEMDQVVKENGGGVVPFIWPELGGTTPGQKISYVKGFEPWGWIVGTGVYTTDIQAVFWGSALTQIIISVVIVFFITLLSWYIGRSISKPLSLASEALQDIAEGDRDLTRRLDITGKDELTEMAKSFNAIVEKLNKTLLEVKSSTAEVERFSLELNSHIKSSQGVLEKQKLQSKTAVQAIMEMVQTVSEIARNAEGAASSAQEANREAELGQGVVEQAKESVNNLASDVQQVSIAIKNLNADSQSISSVLEVIRGIAEQTNLLALNAAIEAARAGEQGRGFAVVADEVRTLAARTQSSTEEIRNMIESLQNGSDKAVTTMGNGEKTTEITVDRAAEAGQSLATIVSAINSISELNLQIASAAEEQSAAVKEIDQSISLMAEFSNSSHFGIEKTSETSRQLTELSGRLKQLVGQFKLTR